MTNLIQGTKEWDEARFKSFTASEAPVMMGASSKSTRNDLLNMKATGNQTEYSDWVQKNLFDRGHEWEDAARKILEIELNEELYPTVETKEIDGLPLMASLDGATMDGSVIFEHKMWNQKLPAAVEANDLPPEYYWQLEHQLLVSGADKAIFVVSDGTPDNFESMEYKPVAGRAEQLIAGWKQFQADLATYEPPEPELVVETKPMEQLPALLIEVKGEVTKSNLDAYKKTALHLISTINDKLITDADFEQAKSDIKWCKQTEERIEAAKDHALAQTSSIDELFRALDEIKEAVRAKRLYMDKTSKDRKNARKNEIRSKAASDFKEFVTDLNKQLYEHNLRLPEIPIDLAGAVRGKSSLKSIQNACDTAVAQAKIEATQILGVINQNLNTMATEGKDYPFLFNDKPNYITRDPQQFREMVEARVIKYQADQKAKEEAERERIRQEEERKARAKAEAEMRAKQEAEAKARAEQQAKERAEQAAKEREAIAKAEAENAEKQRQRAADIKSAGEHAAALKAMAPIEQPKKKCWKASEINEFLSPWRIDVEEGDDEVLDVQYTAVGVIDRLEELIANAEDALDFVRKRS